MLDPFWAGYRQSLFNGGVDGIAEGLPAGRDGGSVCNPTALIKPLACLIHPHTMGLVQVKLNMIEVKNSSLLARLSLWALTTLDRAEPLSSSCFCPTVVSPVLLTYLSFKELCNTVKKSEINVCCRSG